MDINSQSQEFSRGYEWGKYEANQSASAKVERALNFGVLGGVVALIIGFILGWGWSCICHDKASDSELASKIDFVYDSLVNSTNDAARNVVTVLDDSGKVKTSSIIVSDSKSDDIPIMSWYTSPTNGDFILRNVNAGNFVYDVGFFFSEFKGFDIKAHNDELVVKDGQEIKLAKVDKHKDFNDVITFDFLNSRYYISLDSNRHARLLGWKQSMKEPMAIPTPDNHYGGSLFWSGVSFFDKTVYAKVELAPSKHILEVYRDENNIICLKFIRAKDKVEESKDGEQLWLVEVLPHK